MAAILADIPVLDATAANGVAAIAAIVKITPRSMRRVTALHCGV